MSIRQLPDEVVKKLQSSASITSLRHVAIELLKNSLDAGATKVNITVDYARGNCTVEDNGQGIPPGDFKENGGLGRSHCTSKYPPDETIYGRHGDFLSSLATLSLLLVSSKHKQHEFCNSILLHQSRLISRYLPAPTEHHVHAFDWGTRVVARDLFGSMPVRVKQRGSMSNDPTFASKEWSQLIDDVVAVLLSWHGTISLFLKDAASGREIHLKQDNTTELSLRAPRLLSQAFIVDQALSGTWIPLSASSGDISVEGCVSTEPVASRSAQFLSIGIWPVSNIHGTNILYEEINKIFSNSNFGVVEDSSSKVRKGVERWPAFYFQVQIRHSLDTESIQQILDNRTDKLKHILDAIKAVCYGFLKKHHYQPKKIQLRDREAAARKRPRLTAESRCRSTSLSQRQSPFDGWQRIKVGHATALRSKTVSPHVFAETLRPRKERWVDADGQLLRQPFDDPDVDHRPTPEPSPAPVSFRARNSPSRTAVDHATSCSASLAKRSKPEPTPWLKGLLSTWTNPVFATVPSAIPRTYNDDAIGDRTGTGFTQFAHDTDDCGIMFESGSLSLSGSISKAALEQAEVISQVDRKFILVKLTLETKSRDSSSSLVMIDQHAADERYKLEELLATYFHHDAHGDLTVTTEPLDSPIHFEVGHLEGELLQRFRHHFRTWGIDLEVRNDGGKKDESVIQVTSLPPSILERCRLEPRLLINLIRTEAWNLAETRQAPLPPSRASEGSTHPWAVYMSRCPRGILEMLHSRACRSAIMFNDALTIDECRALVRRVARCAYPFQCAHGRPSMAPLLDMGMGQNAGGSLAAEQVGMDLKEWTED
ncbi:uncharacterized protein F5Z01DRAFT_504407 [Emericellopsis atlantica]|uniref:MutL C-terminal dimerisation domain-containing protein n=1 Tax=Emericellopsis atlantica TaxID=2614577 RepID=A0A9P8CRN2_9HYPO|nr:uncharacterized protein F5Z01DRAFT_504407 [Emericellopsis atlantica]KAG9256305.1 hypothetical protein F5Z01DRAFT_504407 [Emericellopsis atlantica]